MCSPSHREFPLNCSRVSVVTATHILIWGFPVTHHDQIQEGVFSLSPFLISRFPSTHNPDPCLRAAGKTQLTSGCSHQAESRDPSQNLGGLWAPLSAPAMRKNSPVSGDFAAIPSQPHFKHRLKSYTQPQLTWWSPKSWYLVLSSNPGRKQN